MEISLVSTKQSVQLISVMEIILGFALSNAPTVSRSQHIDPILKVGAKTLQITGGVISSCSDVEEQYLCLHVTNSCGWRDSVFELSNFVNETRI